MKNILKINVVVIALFVASIMTACNNKKPKEDESATDLQELKTELKSAIEDVHKTEIVEFKKETQELLAEVRTKVEKYETELAKSEKQIDQKTKNNLNELKIRLNELEAKLKKLEDKNEENLVKLKEEIQHDFSELGNSMENFFSDNM